MNDAYHQAMVVDRDRLDRELAALERGEIINGVKVTTTPDTIRLLQAELARLDDLIARDEPNAQGS